MGNSVDTRDGQIAMATIGGNTHMLARLGEPVISYLNPPFLCHDEAVTEFCRGRASVVFEGKHSKSTIIS